MSILATELTRLGHPILGILIPGVILILSIAMTAWLYLHFSKQK